MTPSMNRRGQPISFFLMDERFTMVGKQKTAKTEPKSNGRHELETAKAQPKANRLAARRSASERPRKVEVKHHERKLEKFRGLLQDFNYGPKGGIEGFMLHSEGQTVQVNVSDDVGFAVVRGIGQHVEATVVPDPSTAKRNHGEHPVYSLVALTGTDGKTLIFSGTAESETVTAQGVVKRFNYDRHGAANAVVLDSGDFIRMKPQGMKCAGLKVGDQVTAEGSASLMPLGQQVIEAKTVNGVAVTSQGKSITRK